MWHTQEKSEYCMVYKHFCLKKGNIEINVIQRTEITAFQPWSQDHEMTFIEIRGS